jgi:DNA-binding PadR family transcriptional regulator
VNIQEQLPLTESTFFIMLSLAAGPQHGYAILKEVEALSDGRVVLSTGTLYGALKRMLDAGWLERLEGPESEGNGRERKLYRLTPFGRELLEAETTRLRSLAGLAELRLEGKRL